MDFAFDFSQYKWDHLIMPALRRCFELYGNSDVHKKIHVNFGDDEWSEELWGLNLGTQVQNIRTKGNFKAQVEKGREALTRIEFASTPVSATESGGTRVLPSLVIYRQQFGNCNVPKRFEVPDCPPWPKAAAGLRLGNVVDGMRSRNYYAKTGRS
ncbi:hypothetical protein V7S43_014217 [Phytophthora oleae]|uniref:Uncharacterized protein n=1 Tax=Phytophthora oleae TaxID=2107226 RepID=A0ABD3F462_9STRA